MVDGQEGCDSATVVPTLPWDSDVITGTLDRRQGAAVPGTDVWVRSRAVLSRTPAVRAPRTTSPAGRRLVIHVVHQTGAAAAHRARTASGAGPGRSVLGSGIARRIVGRLDRFLVDRAGDLRLAWRRRGG